MPPSRGEYITRLLPGEALNWTPKVHASAGRKLQALARTKRKVEQAKYELRLFPAHCELALSETMATFLLKAAIEGASQE